MNKTVGIVIGNIIGGILVATVLLGVGSAIDTLKKPVTAPTVQNKIFSDNKITIPADGSVFIEKGRYRVGTDVKAGEYEVIIDGYGSYEVFLAEYDYKLNRYSNYRGNHSITIKDGDLLRLDNVSIKEKQ